MMVDDDKDDQMIFTSAVSEIDQKIKCECFDNAQLGWHGLQADKTLKPSCIFLDLNMPYMHGFEFLKLLKSSNDYNEIPVIIYSTSSRDADKEKAKALGAHNFLIKPTSFNELKDKVTTLLKDVECSG
jgi:CheY-like chemotaxis protein